MPQGKCEECRVVFGWDGKPLMRDACCPRCGSPLRRTTTEKRWRRISRKPKTARKGAS